jgi:Xaa-Pro aminopeptidase
VAEIVTAQEWTQELGARLVAVRQIIAQNGCDLALIYGGWGHAEPFRYLTNFTPVLGDAYAVVSASSIACVLNFNWQLIEASEKSGIADWTFGFNPLPPLLDLLKASSPKRIGVVGLHRLPHTIYSAIQSAFPSAEFVDFGAPVAALRRIKTPLEIRLLKEASRITDAAFDTIRTELKPGLTEIEAAARLTFLMQAVGGGLSFEPTVVSGNDHPIAIRLPTERKLQAGDSIMIDIGASYQGYQADATRTYVLGKPNADQFRVWDLVTRAYEASLAAIRPGVPCLELHRAADRIIVGAGYKQQHRIGHGIGLSTSFEYPSLDTETAPLEAGMTFCLEPGIYVAGAGNMKLEDDVLVTDTGYELLTHSSRELVI